MRNLRRAGRLLLQATLAALVAGSISLAQQQERQSATDELNRYCQLPQAAIERKSKLRQAAFAGNDQDRARYQELVAKHAQRLERCRSQHWPQTQAIWLRLYPCDARPGKLEQVLDRIASRGYNQVHLETFYSGQVLLPASDNPTVWPSAVSHPDYADADLLARAIEQGHKRGLEVHAWLYSMNFGYAYTQADGSDRAILRNGRGKTSLATEGDSKVFIDPYSDRARQQYRQLVEAVLERQPDGVLFDYIRYPYGSGSNSLANNVKDLWIYSEASQQTLIRRTLNAKGRWLLERYLEQGRLTQQNVETLRDMPPQDEAPRWQGYRSAETGVSRAQLQRQLWRLSVAHAAQGVVDFLQAAGQPVLERDIPAGAVFFPKANRTVGKNGFDSRLQPWDSFPGTLDWHAMSYGVCGTPGCIVDQAQRAVQFAPEGTQVIPALAGRWGQSTQKRPSLERQMQALQYQLEQLSALSHFAFSWQYPQRDRERKSCQLP